MKKDIKKIITFLIIACIIITLLILHQHNYLTLAHIKAQKDFLEEYVAHHYISSIFIFMGFYIIETALALPGTALLTMLGGFLFGLWGSLFSIISATVGATLTFMTIRYLVGGTVYKKYKHMPLLKTIYNQLHTNAIYYLLFLRFVPFFPFFLVNILLGLTKINVFTFIWTTALGIIPGDLLYAFAGKQLSTITSVYDIFSFRSMALFALLIIATLIPLIVKIMSEKSEKV
jgi:uncharacterized membrane protein YdjX (TVP38/TMEM64 family)